MGPNDLRVFEAVTRLGGINRAAAELHAVQSNVTARVEARFETLFIRRRDAAVSSALAAFLHHARPARSADPLGSNGLDHPEPLFVHAGAPLHSSAGAASGERARRRPSSDVWRAR